MKSSRTVTCQLADLKILYGTRRVGIAEELGLVEKSGTWPSYEGAEIGQVFLEQEAPHRAPGSLFVRPINRPPTNGRVRAWWGDFLRTWQRLGAVHVELVTAPDDYERWRRLWHRDDRGRYVSHPWRRWHKPGRYA